MRGVRAIARARFTRMRAVRWRGSSSRLEATRNTISQGRAMKDMVVVEVTVKVKKGGEVVGCRIWRSEEPQYRIVVGAVG